MSSQNKKRKRNLSLRADSVRHQRLVQIARQRNEQVQTDTKKKRQTTGFYVTLCDRCINMLCMVSKGISLFFSLFFPSFLLFQIFREAATEMLECLRNPFYVTDKQQTGKRKQRLLFGTSRVFCWFFFLKPLYYHTDKKDTLNKTGTQQQSILKIALVLPFFLCSSPNHTNNSYSNYCGNIVKCYLTSFSPSSFYFVSLLTKTCYKNRSFTTRQGFEYSLSLAVSSCVLLW